MSLEKQLERIADALEKIVDQSIDVQVELNDEGQLKLIADEVRRLRMDLT